jgi:predicted branched-subunit amino acid permease
MNFPVEENSAKLFKKGFNDGIPIGLGYVPLGVGIGIGAINAGMHPGIFELMTAIVYSGTAQVAIMSLFQSGETLLLTYLIAFFVINCRYILLSISMSQKLDPKMSTLSKMVFAPFNTDEVFAVVMQQPGFLQAPYLFGIVIPPYLSMLFGTALGLIFTNFLPASVSSAFGIMLYAMLLALIIPPMRKSKPIIIIVLLAAGINILLECNPFIRQFLSPGWIMIICAIIVAFLGAIFFPVNDEEKPETQEDNSK